MPMKPRSNQSFPCHFSYKGWEISIVNESAQSTVSEIALKADITPNKSLLERELEESLFSDYKQAHQTVYLEDTNTFSSQQHKERLEQLKKVQPLVEQFCKNKSKFSYCCKLKDVHINSVACNNLNLLATAKTDIINYIDEKLGNIKDEFYTFIHE